MQFVRTPWCQFACLALLLMGANESVAQNGGFVVRDGAAGYIDSALPGDVFTLRHDSAWNIRHANRAEFYYPKPGGLGGPGLPNPERSVDFKEATAKLEAMLWSDHTSGFIEVPVRHIEATNNTDTTGWGDLALGIKRVVVDRPDLVITGQLRSWIPVGDGRLGLGTENFSIEPGLLWFQRLPWGERTATFGEFRYWVPVDGTDFAGSIIRTGLGVQRGYGDPDCWHWTPVAELVNWTVLDGKSTIPTSMAPVTEVSAQGDNITNAKIGVRLAYADSGDFYAGYGYALTGDKWYSDILRFEFRMFF